jgi:hypothetical protein
MVGFIATLQRIYGIKKQYPIDQIQSAYNCFCKKQIVDVNHTDFTLKSELKKQGYFKVIQPNHKWENRMVRSAMKPNIDGMVLVYYGSQIDYIHKSKLQ